MDLVLPLSVTFNFYHAVGHLAPFIHSVSLVSIRHSLSGSSTSRAGLMFVLPLLKAQCFSVPSFLIPIVISSCLLLLLFRCLVRDLRPLTLLILLLCLPLPILCHSRCHNTHINLLMSANESTSWLRSATKIRSSSLCLSRWVIRRDAVHLYINMLR